MNLKEVHSIHFVGIKGVAMTSLAIIAKEMGMVVTGSDVLEVFPTDETLKRFGIQYAVGFSADHISEVDLVIYTGAHQGAQNIEVKTAAEKGIPVLPHGKALGLFMEGKRGISVAGSHGKTTTSALLAHLLTKLGKDPSFAIGCGAITSLKTPAHAGKGDFFVAEADEYVTDPTSDSTPRFLWQKPELAVITNIDFDHPDVFESIEAVKKAFITFTSGMLETGTVLLNFDDAVSHSLTSQIQRKIISYGSKNADFTFSNIKTADQQTFFEVFHKEANLGEFKLSIPGVHNVANATAAIAALITLGMTPSDIREHLASFMGTKRRFEKIAEKNGKILFDDYAHHPAEIKATLAAARSWYPDRRILVVFQPHTYSRTKALLNEFSEAFLDANQVVLTDIYASAREKPLPGFDGNNLYAAVKTAQKDVFYAPKCADVLKYISSQTQQNDVIITMGAGDIYSWLPQVAESL